MKKKIIVPDITNVTITVDNNNFVQVPVDISDPTTDPDGYTGCSAGIPTGTDRVTLKAPNLLYVKYGGSGVPVLFVVTIAPASIYQPIGIAFLQKTSAGDALRRPKFATLRSNFMSGIVAISGSTISFSDGCYTKGARFEFYIGIQCIDDSDENYGLLGILDPGILHDNNSQL
jgi:hypothetical protein